MTITTSASTTSRPRRGRTAVSAITALATLVVAIAVAMIAPATPAHAALGCTPEVGVRYGVPGLPEYSFTRCGVPDFDQIRSALPKTGVMYCVPTSAADWLVYLADRGARSVRPGPGVADDYATIDQLISDLGSVMGTTPDGGTNGGLAADALTRWFDQSYGGFGGAWFAVHYDYGIKTTVDDVTHVDRPLTSDLAAAAASGSLVLPSIGWYKPTGMGTQVKNAGAHMTALVSAHPDLTPGSDLGSYLVGFNDPATSEGVGSAQGPWTTELYGTRRTTIQLAGGRTEDIDRFSGPGYSTGYLEGSITITPKFGLFPDPDPITDRMRLHRAVQLDEGPGDRVIDSLDGHVIDLALGADGAETTLLLDDGRLQTLGNLDGTATTRATIPGATNLVLDDKGRTAAIDPDGRVTILDQRHNPVDEVLVPGATGLAFSQPRHAFVTFDAAHQELVLLPEAIPGNPVQPVRQPLLPDGPPISPEASLSIDPATGVTGLLEPGTSRLTRTVVSDGRFVPVDSITLGDGTPLRGLVADATGTWYSTRDGQIVAFDLEGHELPDNPFAGQPSASTFRIFQPVNIGTPPDSPDVLPQDAPRLGDQLAIDQASATEAVGLPHDVTVTLTDEAGAPLAGRPVAFSVAGANPASGTATTDGGGHAVLAWTGTATGTDRLTAWEDLDLDAALDADEPAASLEVTWTAPIATATSVELTSSANPSRRGQRVTFTATVTAPGAGASPEGVVQFTSDGQALGAAVPVDATGTAARSTRSMVTGTHRIEATFTPVDGNRFLQSSALLHQFVGTYTWTGNLVRNGGADDAPGSPTGDVVPVPAWDVITGNASAVQYGAVDPGSGLAFPTAAAGPPDGGANFFAGGPGNASAVAVQAIPLPGSLLAAIDAGTATYRFRAWLGGFEDQDDLCEPVVLFTDGDGAPLDRAFLIGGQAADRSGQTELLPYDTQGQVPPGARSAHVALEFSRTAGLYNDGYCDSVTLRIARPR